MRGPESLKTFKDILNDMTDDIYYISLGHSGVGTVSCIEPMYNWKLLEKFWRFQG